MVALLQSKIRPTLSATCGVRVCVKDSGFKLKTSIDVVNPLSAPFSTRGVTCKTKVIYSDMPGNRVNCSVNVLIEDGHCCERSLRRQASRLQDDGVLRQPLLQIQLAKR